MRERYGGSSDAYSDQQLRNARERLEVFSGRRALSWGSMLASVTVIGLAFRLESSGIMASVLIVVSGLLCLIAVGAWARSKDRSGWWFLAGLFGCWLGLFFLWLSQDFGYGPARARVAELTRRPAPVAISPGILVVLWLVALAVFISGAAALPSRTTAAPAEAISDEAP